MIKRVLVPLDGSHFAEHAIPSAVAVAKRAGASLELVSVCRPPSSSTYVRGARVYDDSVVRDAVAVHHRYLVAKAAVIKQVHGLDSDISVLVGPVLETLLAHVSSSLTDLVVMSTHGGDSPNTTWLGSTTDRMIRESQVPLLLVRPSTDRGSLGTEATVRTILTPSDGSRVAERVVRMAGEFALLFDAEIALFCAVPVGSHPLRSPLASLTPDDEDALERNAEEMRHHLGQLADELRACGVRASVRVVRHDHAATAIEETAIELKADLIAMATHGRGGVRKLFLGSVADKVLRSSSTAILLVGPGAA